MHYVKQFTIILAISFLGELCNLLIPLPIPAAIYGLIIMLFTLQFHIVKLEQVQEVGHFLLETMTILFVPYAIALLPVWPQLRPILTPVLIISIASTILVILVTGHVTQWCIRAGERKKK